MDKKIHYANQLLETARNTIKYDWNKSCDQATSSAIRQITNHFIDSRPEFSGRASSVYIKERNRNLSYKAKELLEIASNFKEFHSKTDNEHQLPAANVWSWILENVKSQGDSFTSFDIMNYIGRYPIVSVLKSEHQLLTDHIDKKNRDISPERRYELAGIEVIVLPYPPREHFKKFTK